MLIIISLIIIKIIKGCISCIGCIGLTPKYLYRELILRIEKLGNN